MLRPDTRYVKSGASHVAYQVVGDGPTDVVLVAEWWYDLHAQWDDGQVNRFLSALTSFARLIVFDRPGFGLSDRDRGDPAGAAADTARAIGAVMDAAESERAAILATGDGVPAAILFAADHPARVQSLALFNGFARLARADDYSAGMPTRMQQQMLDEISEGWGTPGNYGLVAPSVGGDPDFQRSFSRRLGQSVDRGAAHWLLLASLSTDVRDRLDRISSPTLVLHRAANPFAKAAHSRYLADRIPDARYIELDGDDHIWWLGDSAQLLDLVEEFITGEPSARATRGSGPRSRPKFGWAALTPTEITVVQLMAQGLRNDQIAAHMFISKATVKTHLNHVYAKVGLNTRTELVAEAIRRDL